MKRLLTYLFFAVLATPVLAVAVLLGAYFYMSATLPQVESLADYQPPLITTIYADDGTVIAEYSHERRFLVPYEKMPKTLVQAFVASEDAGFFKHQGIDFVSIMRAAINNIKAGGISQGGSTITQQVAKTMLLTPERTFTRKFKEAILAWRMEQTLTKEEILTIYLNQIYLGHRSYGVEAAARSYFDKTVEDLTLAESAILAGLPQAPSRYSPYRHYQRAMDRQKYVLGRMLEEGFITPAEKAAAEAEEVVITPRLNTLLDVTAYFNEQVRRYLEQRFGEDLLYTGGLQVETSINLKLQQAAQQAVKENLRAHDKRRGFRPVEMILNEAEQKEFLAAQRQEFVAGGLEVGSETRAVVVGRSGDQLLCRIGDHNAAISISESAWAGTIEVVDAETEPTGNADDDHNSTRLPVGAVIDVRVLHTGGDPLELALEQEPLAQAALAAIDPRSGQIRAMVGGYDFRKSQFNRAIQAQRLPGSAFKPIIYAAALDRGYTPASIILDTPLIYENRQVENGDVEEWKPKNYEEKFYGPTRFREALTHSRNVVTVKILEDIGVGYAASYARKLGIETPLQRDLSMALGSTAITPMEMLTAYTVFASGGILSPPTYITRIRDRNGRILESIDPTDFATGMAADQRLIRQAPRRVISPETAYLTTNIMESVVQHGTGRQARVLNRPSAGKTGTTNDLKDAWYVGYIPQLAAVSWIGYDQEQPLGRRETGGRAALPAWIAFMQEAIKLYPAEHFPVPDTIEFYPIDRQNGLLVAEDNKDAYYEAFSPGSAPTRMSSEPQFKARDFFRLDL
ncbi:MAG: PBP1A family penicillin-binding protein [Pelovirga sp.]